MRSKNFKIRHTNLNIIIIVIAIVMVWRMTWGLMDTYLFPDKPALSYLLGGIIGLFILWVDDFRLTELHEHNVYEPKQIDKEKSIEKIARN